MAYEFHITRSENWLEDSAPITLAEIESALRPLPPGFSVDRSGCVSAATPEGRTLTAAVGDYLVYEDPDNPDSRVHIYFDADLPPFFRISTPEQLLPIIGLAEKLGAAVQGDELEFYTIEDVYALMHARSIPQKNSFLQRIRNLSRKLRYTRL